MNKYKSIAKLGIAQRDAFKLLELIIDKPRYNSIVLKNYVYNTDVNIQFSAVTYVISKRLNYICFEGTDEMVSGWKEDGQLCCFFPIPSHVEAIKYVNNNINLFGPNIIIGGHSKGGNLALVASMFLKKIKRIKIKKVYSNDGPGLRINEFNSKEYKSIKKKYVHIVPHSSVVGVLLNNDVYSVVKSSKNSLFGHAISTWQIDDDKLINCEMSQRSKKIESSVLAWLELHDDYEREHIINSVFKIFEDAGITDFSDVPKIKNIIKIISNMRNIDKQSRDLIIDFITYNFKNIIIK